MKIKNRYLSGRIRAVKGIPLLRKGWAQDIASFVTEVNNRAIAKIVKTGVREGAHYAAMREVLVDIRKELK
jgi:hypothetical protein